MSVNETWQEIRLALAFQSLDGLNLTFFDRHFAEIDFAVGDVDDIRFDFHSGDCLRNGKKDAFVDAPRSQACTSRLRMNCTQFVALAQ